MSTNDDAAWDDLVKRLEAVDSGTVEPSEEDPLNGQQDETRLGAPGATDGTFPGTASPGRPGDQPASGIDFDSGPRAVAGFNFRVDPALGAAPGPRDWSAGPEEPEEPFVPEEPTPLLAGRPDRVVAWLAAVCMPLVMLFLVIFWRGSTPPLLWPVLIVGSICAWGYLIWKMPTERADDTDDGARL